MFCIYLEESTPKTASEAQADRNVATPVMSAEAKPIESKPIESKSVESPSAENRRIVHGDIGAKWSRFSAQDLSALKDRDGLVREVVSKYGVEKSEAQRDVDSVLKGRPI
jgi:hypothetical protein